MGKDKEKKRSRRPSSSGGSGDDSSSSDGHRDEKRREKKKHKKEKDRKGKERKGKHADKDDLVRQARAFLEQQLTGAAAGAGAGKQGGGPPSSTPHGGLGGSAGAGPLPPVQVSSVKEPIGEDDYFRRHAEFAAFLAEERRTQFNELSSERSRELFEEFVRIWNEGRLAPRYYAGLVAAPLRRTEYRWNLKGPPGAAAGRPGGDGLMARDGGGRGGGATGLAAFMEDQRGKQAGALQADRRQDRARAREFLEEVAPRETGRDKMVAERSARRELARSSRDDDGPGGFVPGGGRGGDDLLGGGDSFAAAKAREARRMDGAKQRGLVRAEDVAQRTAAFQAREDEKMAGLRALLAKGPITIAKRT